MNNLAAETLQQAERAHYFLQSAAFIGGRRDIPGASLFSSSDIADPEWNHAGLVRLESAQLPAALELARQHYRAIARPAAIMVSPFSQPPDLEALLEHHGFVPAFKHMWHFVDRTAVSRGAVPPVELARGIEIRRVRDNNAMRDFVDVFARVYSVDLDTGEPEKLPAGYVNALMRSQHPRQPGLDVVHYLARVGPTPAGVATSIHATQGYHRGTSGLYNLAVLPEFRRQGLGAALVRRRAIDALDRGQRTVFLQTERDSVARRLVRHGFIKRFTSIGFMEGAA